MHPFIHRPHRTLLALSLPVLFSLIAEPLTGLVDTAFVARLGATPVAALGVATTLLTSVFWVFNFLGIGTQTEIARAFGAGHRQRAQEAATLAMVVAALLGTLLAVAAGPWLPGLAGFMGADGTMRAAAVHYLAIRLVGGPAILVTIAAFGALRGLQDMRTPLWIAVTVNALNIALDALLIFGGGPVPAMGIAGAAWASTASQWVGAGWAVHAVRRAIGLAPRLRWREALALLVVGRDLFFRTGSLIVFVVLATRTATRIGAEAGAAHQAIRQIWIFAALLLDAYAATGQSLVGYFLGAGRVDVARHVAAVACQWGLGTGVLLAGLMLMGERAAAWLLVPPAAWAVFSVAWVPAALAQPLNAVSFVTDGVHWGTGDYRYLRNGMLTATAAGAAALALIDLRSPAALTTVWVVTAGWIAVRCGFGVVRIWPGVGHSPLRGVRHADVTTSERSSAPDA